METITFICETVTPMFLAGADGRTPDLRPPSIKGAIRFWWRAMNGHLSLEQLKKRETEIFGGSGENEGRSKVIIRIDQPLRYDGGYKYTPIPRKNFQLPAFSPLLKYSITLSLNHNVTNNDSENFDLEKIKSLFILFSILGGLGKRARRGFGSFKILKINDNPYNIEYSLENILNLVNSIGNKKYKLEDNRIVLKENITTQYPFVREIQLGKKCGSWEKLVKKVSEASHQYNSWGTGSQNTDDPRFASPIYVSILKNDNKYYPIITTLNAVYPSGITPSNNKSQEFKEAIL